MSLRHHVTAPDDRIPLRSRIAYGSAGMIEHVVTHNVSSMTFIVLNMTLGIDPFLIGLVAMIPRFWDGFIDPFLGNLSDHTTGGWGRRKPYMFFGAIFTAVFLILVWMFPRDWSPEAQLGWFLGCTLLLFTASSVYLVPYTAMGYELTPDYHERTRVLSFRYFFTIIIALAGGWTFWMVEQPLFHDALEGVRWISLVTSVIVLAVGLAPVVYCRERHVIVSSDSATKKNLWRDLKESLANKAFQRVLSAQLLITLCTSSIITLGQYVTVYYMAGGDKDVASIYTGHQSTAFTLAFLVSTPLTVALSVRFGKLPILLWSLLIQLAGATSKYWLYSKELPMLSIVPAVLYGPAFAALSVLSASMIADICDDDELRYGTRREGMFGAASSWCNKLAFSLSSLVAGFLVNVVGFDASKGMHQDPGVIDSMRLLFGSFPIVGIVAAFFFLHRYPITEEAAYNIKQKLEKQRAGSSCSIAQIKE